MQFPPHLEVERTSFATNAAINTNTNTVVLAAPGNNNRIRLWAVSLAFGSTPDLPNRTRIRIQETGARNLDLFSFAGFDSAFHQYPGGIGLAENTSITAQHMCGVANVAIESFIYWTNELVGS